MADLSDIPDGEMPVITNHIQILWNSDTLGGYWGCTHLWDDFDERKKETLVVRGVPMSDAEAAEQAMGWLHRQLSRPIDMEVWKSGDRVVARRWVLSDTGYVIGKRGRWQWRRRPPAEVIPLRPAMA